MHESINLLREKWKAIGGIAFSLALFFTLIAVGQYFYTAHSIYSSARQQLESNASDAISASLDALDPTNEVLIPSRLDTESFSAPNYIVLSNDGLIEQVYSADKSNQIPKILSQVTRPEEDYSNPKPYQTQAGDTWTILVKTLPGGYAVLAISANSGVTTPNAVLAKNAALFHSVNGVISVNASHVDNAVDYAIVDDSKTITQAAGFVPLKTNLPATNSNLDSLKRNTGFLFREENIVTSNGNIGVVIVWTDLTRETAVLNHELFFFAGLAIFSWLIALWFSLRYWSRSEMGKRELRRAFQNYLSPQVMEAILKDPNKVKLGGQRREVTILFSDIRSFTSLTEKLPPQQLTQLLQEYFNAMTEEVIATEGVVDKYIGDAIMAFWGAPIDQPDQADRAVKTAINMIKRLKELQAKWVSEGYPILDIGIGINLGVATVGNFGSHQRFDYTLIGDAVNAASRIEGLNKQFDSHIIISESTLKQLSIPVPTRDLGEVQVKGKEELIRVYAVEA